MNTRKNVIRKLFTEALEGRALMAGDLTHNFLTPHDVNDDSRISPVDALHVINGLNQLRDDNPSASDLTETYRDVNDDSRLSPTDALLVINVLNVRSDVSSGTAASSGTAFSKTEARVNSGGKVSAQLEFEVSGTQKELSIKIRDAAPGQSYPVSLNDLALGELMTDSKGRGKIVLSEGDDNSSHLPLPTNLPPLTSETELTIGDIVQGRLTRISVSSGTGADDSSSSGGSSSGGSSSGGSSSSSGGSSSSSSASSNWLANFAPLGQLQRKAEYETETEGSRTKTKFKIEIEGAKQGQTYSVSVGDFSLGEVTIGSKGKAKVTWSTSPKEGELTLPAGFPSINESTVLTIGDSTTKFVRI